MLPLLDKQVRDEARKECSTALRTATSSKMPSWESLFDDVYDKLTPNLIKQKQQLSENIQKYEKEYDISRFHKEEGTH